MPIFSLFRKQIQLYLLAPLSGDRGQQPVRVEPDDSLAGERTHGLPNVTGSNGSKNKNKGKDSTASFLSKFILNSIFFRFYFYFLLV